MHRTRLSLALALCLAPLALSAAALGCATSSEVDPREGPPREDGGTMRPPGAPDPWSLEVDTSGVSPYVALDATAVAIEGRVIASEGVGALSVAGASTTVAADGRFTASVPVAPGLVHVEIEATDADTPTAHSRRADRSLLVSRFLPEGELDARAAALVLSNEVVAAMSEGLQDRVAGLDIASEIMMRPTLTDDSCRTVPTAARHGTARLRTFIDEAGRLFLEIVIPDLRIEFRGTCRALITTTDVTGSMEASVVIRTELTSPPSDACAVGLSRGPVDVTLADFDLSVRGGSGIFGLITSLAGELREGDTAEQLRGEFAAQAGALLDAELGSVSIFDQESVMELFGVSLDVGLCLTGLISESGMLRAIVGSRVRGPGTFDAPGAPQVEGTLPPARAGTLVLDANLVAQLVYSAWRAGALTRDGVLEVDAGMLAIVAPELATRFPRGTMVSVDLDGELPPLVRAAPAAAPAGPDDPAPRGDLFLEIGDLDLVLRVGTEELFRVGNVLRFGLELVPEGEALRPMVVSVEAVTWIEEEPIADANDRILAGVINGQIGDAAAGLLGDARIALPALGATALVASDVTPAEGGRYIEVTLAP